MKPKHDIGNSIWTSSRDKVLQGGLLADQHFEADAYLIMLLSGQIHHNWRCETTKTIFREV